MEIQIGQPLYIQGEGQRDHQEDTFRPTPENLDQSCSTFIVCDGMGGHEHGKEASRLAADGLFMRYDSFMKDQPSEENFLALYRDVLQILEGSPYAIGGDRSMGTTFTLVSMTSEGMVAAHLGDSMIFVIRPGKITRFVYRSADHNRTYEMVKYRQLTPIEALTYQFRNILDKAMIPFTDYKPDMCLIKDLQAGDYVFLCTDGVTEYLTDEMIRFIFAPYRSTDEIVDLIQRHCKLSSDNYTALIIPITEVSNSAEETSDEDNATKEDNQTIPEPVDWDKHFRKEAQKLLASRKMGVDTDPLYTKTEDNQVTSEESTKVGNGVGEYTSCKQEPDPSSAAKPIQPDYTVLYQKDYKSDKLLEQTKNLFKIWRKK